MLDTYVEKLKEKSRVIEDEIDNSNGFIVANDNSDVGEEWEQGSQEVSVEAAEELVCAHPESFDEEDDDEGEHEVVEGSINEMIMKHYTERKSSVEDFDDEDDDDEDIYDHDPEEDYKGSQFCKTREKKKKDLPKMKSHM